jgi:hypothetical protein
MRPTTSTQPACAGKVYGHWRDDDPEGFETEIYWLLSATRSSAS